LNAELLEDNPDALWTRDIIEAGRQLTAPACIRIVVAIDPPVTSGPDADECGIVAVGLDAQGGFYVLEDLSKGGLKPAEWASRAIGVFDRLKADRVVAEVNQGGEMVEAVLRQIAPHVSFRAVRATKGKAIRAEPIAALYEQGRVHHLGQLAKLEDQLCEFVPGVTAKALTEWMRSFGASPI
jgi:phage terminase large subunit-like protein